MVLFFYVVMIYALAELALAAIDRGSRGSRPLAHANPPVRPRDFVLSNDR